MHYLGAAVFENILFVKQNLSVILYKTGVRSKPRFGRMELNRLSGNISHYFADLRHVLKNTCVIKYLRIL